MQDRYSGDVGDFGKYGLLRFLARETGRSLGIVWYLFPNEAHNDDGRYITYLEKESFRACNPSLFEKMRRLVQGERAVRRVEASGTLPSGTRYFSDCVDFYALQPGMSGEARQWRRKQREAWLDRASAAMAGAPIILLDPDNGLAPKSCASADRKAAGKYVFFSEVRRFLEIADVLVTYQHFGRTGTHPQQMQRVGAQIVEEAGAGRAVIGMRFHAYSSRAYFLVTRERLAERICQAVNAYCAGPWKRCWDEPIVFAPTRSYR